MMNTVNHEPMIRTGGTPRPLGRERSDMENEIYNTLSPFRRIYVMFSGGRDSLVALHMTWKIFPEKTEALFINTSISTPGLIEYVKEITSSFNIPLHILQPKEDYFTLVEKKGFPTINYRWCKYLSLIHI